MGRRKPRNSNFGTQVRGQSPSRAWLGLVEREDATYPTQGRVYSLMEFQYSFEHWSLTTQAIPCVRHRLVARSGQRWGSHPAVTVFAPTAGWFSPDYRSGLGVTPTSLMAAASFDGCPMRRENVGYVGTDRGPTTGEPSRITSGTQTLSRPGSGPSGLLTHT